MYEREEERTGVPGTGILWTALALAGIAVAGLVLVSHTKAASHPSSDEEDLITACDRAAAKLERILSLEIEPQSA